VRETLLERIAEVIVMREQVAAAKKEALEREEKWMKFMEWRWKQDEYK
jgi:hypothetical protein